jgi:hypothetical protein
MSIDWNKGTCKYTPDPHDSSLMTRHKNYSYSNKFIWTTMSALTLRFAINIYREIEMIQFSGITYIHFLFAYTFTSQSPTFRIRAVFAPLSVVLVSFIRLHITCGACKRTSFFWVFLKPIDSQGLSPV